MRSRRRFMNDILRGGTAGAAALIGFRDNGLTRALEASAALGNRPPDEVARDETYWREIQQAFTLDRTIINLNNGGVCPSPRVVHEAMKRYLDISNQSPVYHMWQILEPNIESVRREIAREFGCDREEIAITRNASEALQIAQLGLDMERGDEVVTTNQDYPRMLDTWEQRVRRDGIKLIKVSYPTPATSLSDIVKPLEAAITPRTKVLHFCHVVNLTGQIFPVAEICRIARARGITTIVDGAHAFAHFPFNGSELGCDYYGTSLHKWLLAPVGTGFLYARRENIGRLWPLTPASQAKSNDIRKFEEIGTHPAAQHNAIAEALAFHRGIGVERKAARLRYLRERWARQVEKERGVQFFTSFEPEHSCGLANVGVEGIDPGKITEYMWTRYRILVTPIKHAEYAGIRVTPNVYTTINELDTFAEAMHEMIGKGLLS
jgi:isopenicillin-N epimerase